MAFGVSVTCTDSDTFPTLNGCARCCQGLLLYCLSSILFVYKAHMRRRIHVV
jgi:hypothetical protein